MDMIVASFSIVLQDTMLLDCLAYLLDVTDLARSALAAPHPAPPR
jgi:hypothetical protein